ncbi:RagB/SusD family nutrient uptake outer membrane protein [Olivibacter sitiensis]|uniref:RagB/SusD family nutrient uptake outer membrane protein n=1 Tax=Olivibacter sitiensis TaxID=376470 RepID=UPI000422EA4F|nr:RagB/SusD family nutrient uptake outer membrane protein [Olivibacter sitiensis]
MKIISRRFLGIRLFFLGILLSTMGCDKYLEEKSDLSLSTLSSADDLQALLDNYSFMNTNFSGAGEVSTTDFYVKDEVYESFSFDQDKSMYQWAGKNLFVPANTTKNDWQYGYEAIYYCNSILEALSGQISGMEDRLMNIAGQAYFWRAFRYFHMAQIWCLPYDVNSATSSLGLPLRTAPDFNLPSQRSSMADTYRLIWDDLHQAIARLPETTGTKARPSRAAAYALAARISLSMGDYSNADLYADSAFAYGNSLIDYNDLNPEDSYPIKDLNNEMLVWASMSVYQALYAANLCVVPDLLALYDDSDLRKVIYFKVNADGSYMFKGEYTGSYTIPVGLMTDELYLIKAECRVRVGDLESGRAYLNQLLEKRFRSGTFVPVTVDERDQLLEKVLTERRKELLFRGLRWIDIRRLNQEGYGITQSRTVGGIKHTLNPNDAKYALAIPEDVIALTGMEQNPL